jgi:FimV-like protein
MSTSRNTRPSTPWRELIFGERVPARVAESSRNPVASPPTDDEPTGTPSGGTLGGTSTGATLSNHSGSPTRGVSDTLPYSEATAKLELARGYLDLGVKDGARELILEIMRDGSREQRTQAESLLRLTFDS